MSQSTHTKPSAPRRSLLRDTRGLSTVEYVIILAMVAIGGITVWQGFGEQMVQEIEGSTGFMENVHTRVAGEGNRD